MDFLSEEEKQLAKAYKCEFSQLPANEDKYGNKLLLIRHALSEFNFIFEKFYIENPTINRTAPEYDDLRTNIQHLDTPLNALGVKQCISNQDIISKIDTELVLISPLQRTIQTATILFQKHPNRKNIRFLIFPWLAESLNTSCCISNQIYGEMRNKYIQEAAKYDIKLDFSILDDKKIFPSQLRWQIEQLVDCDEKLKDLAKDITDEKEYVDHLTSQMRVIYPVPYENWDQLIKRAEIIKEKLKDILKSEQKTVTLVGHCNILKCLTKTMVDEKGWVHGVHINNCGMTYYAFE